MYETRKCSYSIEIEDNNVINVSLIGLFDLSSTKEYTNKMYQAIETLEGKPFYIILNILEYEGATPEALYEANKMEQSINNSNNLKEKIYIEKNNFFFQLSKHYMKEIAFQKRIHLNSLEEAKKYLKQKKDL